MEQVVTLEQAVETYLEFTSVKHPELKYEVREELKQEYRKQMTKALLDRKRGAA